MPCPAHGTLCAFAVVCADRSSLKRPEFCHSSLSIFALKGGSLDRRLFAFVQINLAQTSRNWPRCAITQRHAVNLHNRHHKGTCRGGKRLIRFLGFLNCEQPLFDLQLCLCRYAQHCLPGDAMQDVIAQRPRHNHTVLHEIRVVGGALGHIAVFNHPCVICTGLLGHHLAHRRVQQLHRFDVATAPADILNADNLHALLGRRIVSKAGLVLGEQNDRRRRRVRVWKGKVAIIRRTAGDLQINHTLVDTIHAHQLAMHLQKVLFRNGRCHVQLIQRALQAHGMTVKIDQLAIQNRCHLIDAIRHQKPAIKDRHLGLSLGQVITIHINSPHIIYPLSRGQGPGLFRCGKASVARNQLHLLGGAGAAAPGHPDQSVLRTVQDQTPCANRLAARGPIAIKHTDKTLGRNGPTVIIGLKDPRIRGRLLLGINLLKGDGKAFGLGRHDAAALQNAAQALVFRQIATALRARLDQRPRRFVITLKIEIHTAKHLDGLTPVQRLVHHRDFARLHDRRCNTFARHFIQDAISPSGAQFGLTEIHRARARILGVVHTPGPAPSAIGRYGKGRYIILNGYFGQRLGLLGGQRHGPGLLRRQHLRHQHHAYRINIFTHWPVLPRLAPSPKGPRRVDAHPHRQTAKGCFGLRPRGAGRQGLRHWPPEPRGSQAPSPATTQPYNPP
mmetsp:Transcript_170/g.537  ORF Transcript_170/g.537 Transcript_170/m.537 type:complete len:672 (+) Transcript_170:116-2131(+)